MKGERGKGFAQVADALVQRHGVRGDPHLMNSLAVVPLSRYGP